MDGWNEMRQDACRTESCKCATKLGSLGMGGCHVLAFLSVALRTVGVEPTLYHRFIIFEYRNEDVLS